MKRWFAAVLCLCVIAISAQSVFAQEEGDDCECGADEYGECLPCDEEAE